MKKLSLFSGIGGDDLASELAEIETVCFVENDKFCQKVLRKHWPGVPIIEDVKDVKKEKLKELTGEEYVDIIAGGDPCQPRSIAGQRRGQEDDRDLWPDMFRVIREFKPAWALNENPTGRLTVDFYNVLSDLESVGYETRSFIIPACAVNAVHRRDRLFVVAYSPMYGCQRRRGVEGLPKLASNKIEICTPRDGIRAAFDYRKKLISSPSVSRAYDGFSLPVVKRILRGFGNAVIPGQVYPIYKAIVGIENSK